MVQQVLHGALLGRRRLREIAQEGDHRDAPVLDLLDLFVFVLLSLRLLRVEKWVDSGSGAVQVGWWCAVSFPIPLALGAAAGAPARRAPPGALSPHQKRSSAARTCCAT